MKPKIVYNGQIFTPDGIYDNGAIIIDEAGKIEDVVKVQSTSTLDNLVARFSQECRINADGQLIAPGSIDIHTHGFGSYDALSGSIEGMSQAYARYGVTAFCPTIQTEDKERIKQALEQIYRKRRSKGAAVLPAHLECTFLSPEKPGSHDIKYFEKPNIETFVEFYKSCYGYIGIVTLAPELEGTREFVDELKKLNPNIILSAGHTNGTYQDGLAAVDMG